MLSKNIFCCLQHCRVPTIFYCPQRQNNSRFNIQIKVNLLSFQFMCLLLVNFIPIYYISYNAFEPLHEIFQLITLYKNRNNKDKIHYQN